MILLNNQFLETYNAGKNEKDNGNLTRDTKTVQGAINTMNDIINKITGLAPGTIPVVDAYGRIHGATQTSAQDFTYTNYGKDKQELNEANPSVKNITREDQWIYWDIDDNASNPQVILKHRLVNGAKEEEYIHDALDNTHFVETTNTMADKNDNHTITSYDGVNNSNSGGDKDNLKLYSPIVDAAGHVVGRNEETVILPYGYKYLTTNGISNAVTNPSTNTTTTVALNTQDTLTVNSSNK